MPEKKSASLSSKPGNPHYEAYTSGDIEVGDHPFDSRESRIPSLALSLESSTSSAYSSTFDVEEELKMSGSSKKKQQMMDDFDNFKRNQLRASNLRDADEVGSTSSSNTPRFNNSRQVFKKEDVNSTLDDSSDNEDDSTIDGWLTTHRCIVCSIIGFLLLLIIGLAIGIGIGMSSNSNSSRGDLNINGLSMSVIDEKQYYILLRNGTSISSDEPPLCIDSSNLCWEQETNGNLKLYHSEEESGSITVMWQSGYTSKEGSYFSLIQTDGNFLTRRGTPENFVRQSVWKTSTNKDGLDSSLFIALSEDMNDLILMVGTPENPEEKLYSFSLNVNQSSPQENNGNSPSNSKNHYIDWEILDSSEKLSTMIAAVGDTVTFHWVTGKHNVFIHPTNTCDEKDSIEVGPTKISPGVATYTFTDADVGLVTFACDIGEHCESGNMMVRFMVSNGGDSPTQKIEVPTALPTSPPTISPTERKRHFEIDWEMYRSLKFPGDVVYPGDTVTFTWTGANHNIFKHPTHTCDATGSVQISPTSTGAGSFTYTFSNTDVGYVTFACDVGTHCESGNMIANFQVLSLDDDTSEQNEIVPSPTLSPPVSTALPTPLASSTVKPVAESPASYTNKIHSVNWYMGMTSSVITATVGDVVTFTWMSMDRLHDVYRHPSNTCDEAGRIQVAAASIGPSSATYLFTENDVGLVTFACDIGDHCESGNMMVTFQVLPSNDGPSAEQVPSSAPISPTAIPTPAPTAIPTPAPTEVGTTTNNNASTGDESAISFNGNTYYNILNINTFIASGSPPLCSSSANVCWEQETNGNIKLYNQGNDDNILIWESGFSSTEGGQFISYLQRDGNFLTKRGTPDSYESQSLWKTGKGEAGAGTGFFVALSDDMSSLVILKGSPENPIEVFFTMGNQ